MAVQVPAPAPLMNSCTYEIFDELSRSIKNNPRLGLSIIRGQGLVLCSASSPSENGNKISTILEGLHYSVRNETFLTKDDAVDKIMGARNRVTKEDESFFIYFIQENPRNSTNDNLLLLNEIVDLLSPIACPELADKPKIVFAGGCENNVSKADNFFICNWNLTQGDDKAFQEAMIEHLRGNMAKLRKMEVIQVVEGMKEKSLLNEEISQTLSQSLPENKAKELLRYLENTSAEVQREFLVVFQEKDLDLYNEIFSESDFKNNKQSFVQVFERIFTELAFDKDLSHLSNLICQELLKCDGAFGKYNCSVLLILDYKFYFFPGIPNLLPIHKEASNKTPMMHLVMTNIAYHHSILVIMMPANFTLLESLVENDLLSKGEYGRLREIKTEMQRSHFLLGVITRKSSCEELWEFLLSSGNQSYEEAILLMRPWSDGALRLQLSTPDQQKQKEMEAFFRQLSTPDQQKHKEMEEFFRQLSDANSRFRKNLLRMYDIQHVTTIGEGPWVEFFFQRTVQLEQFLEDTRDGKLPRDVIDTTSMDVTVLFCDGKPMEELFECLKKLDTPMTEMDSAYGSRLGTTSTSVPSTEHQAATAMNDRRPTSQMDSAYGSHIASEPSHIASEPQRATVTNANQGNVLQNAIKATLFSMIESRDYSVHDFEKVLRTKMKPLKLSITDMKNERGMTVLHSICERGRQAFLPSLVRMGYWAPLRQLSVPHNPLERCSDKDGRQIAENITRSRKLVVEYDDMERWELSLNKLHKAVRDGNVSEVEKFLASSSRLKDEKDYYNCTMLYWACVSGKTELLDKLRRRLNPRSTNKKNETLLHITCIMGHSHFIKTLIIDCGIEREAMDFSGKTALDYTAENGDIETFSKMLEHGVQLTRNLSLHAAYYGREAYYKMLVENSYLGDLGTRGEHGKTALMRAAEASRYPIVKYIVNYGKTVNWLDTDDRRRNVLHYAADGGDSRVMEELVRGAKKDGKLTEILNSHDYYVGSELCFLIRGKDKGRRAWHYVEVRRSLVHSFVKRTRSGSVDVAMFGKVVKSGWGTDPEDSVMGQLEERFRVRIRDQERSGEVVQGDVTPLHIACFKEHLDTARILLEAGADPDLLDSFHLTSLHISAMRGNVGLVELLEKFNADSTKLSLDNKTAVQVAEENEHGGIVNFIRGKDHVSTSKQFIEFLEKIKLEFTGEKLEELRNEGKDVKRHLIDNLRDITIEVNEFLLSMGSGPVMEESAPYQQAHA